MKWNDLATSTAVVATQTAMVVGNNNAWNLGHRTFTVENSWLATVTSARTLASAIYEAVSGLTRELDFSTSFVPHLEVLDLINVSYDSAEAALNTRWDFGDWAADNTSASNDLIWAGGDALSFIGDEFKLTAIDINLDSLECRFVGIKTGGYNRNVGGNTVGSAIVGDAILG